MEEAVLGAGTLRTAIGRGLVGAEDEFAEVVFLLREGLGFLAFREAATDVEVGLAFVATEVQDFEGAKVLFFCFFFSLYADEPFTCRMDGEFSEISHKPFSI